MASRQTTRSVARHEVNGAGAERATTCIGAAAPEAYGTTLLGEKLLSYARLAAAMHAQADAGRAHESTGFTEGSRA